MGLEICAPRILVVDDESGIRQLLRRILESKNYQVIEALDGLQALAEVARQPPDLILMDLEMPHLGGYEVCRRLKNNSLTRFIPIVILTGVDDSRARIQAWELGTDDFLTKPFQMVEVLARCRSLLRVKGLIAELDNAQAVMAAFNRAVEAKSPYTMGHSERVTQYALSLAERLGLSAADCEVLHRGAALHDIGKISIPDAILNKPGPLTNAEFELVKEHPVVGARIVEPLRSMQDVIPLIRWHHERLDGTGYPDGLFGGSIPFLTRILAVADVYDALASARPYRQAIPPEVCLEMLHKNAAEGGLDPELVAAFTAIAHETHQKVQGCASIS